MTTTIELSYVELAIASVLVIGLAATSIAMKLGLAGSIVLAAVRTAVQLTLVGFVLKALFGHVHPGWMILVSAVMLGVHPFMKRMRDSMVFT